MALPSENLVTRTLTTFLELTEKPELFLSIQKNKYKQFKDATKGIYDLSKSAEHGSEAKSEGSLPELVIQDFDEEQIWQELELQNSSTIDGLVSQIPSLTTHREELSFCRRKAEKLREKALVEKTSSQTVKDKKAQTKRTRKVTTNDETTGGPEEDDENADEFGDDGERQDDRGSDEESDNDDSDAELNKIKSRLQASMDDDDEEDDLDFDFGNLGNEYDDLKDSDDNEEIQSEEVGDDVENTDQMLKQSKPKMKVRFKSKGSVVDDKFFKLADMAAFLDQEDSREEKERKKAEVHRRGDEEQESSSSEEDDDIDMYEASDDEVAGKTATYEDFFDPPEDGDSISQQKQKLTEGEGSKDGSDGEEEEEEGDVADEEEEEDGSKGRDLLGSSDSDEGETVEDVIGGQRKDDKSTFEKRQEKLQQRIAQMEDASLEQKTWQLKGEVASSSRPENSLLEEHLQFDHTTKLAPVITQETTENLEAIITQRIKDKAYDDVERKIQPKEDPFEYKKRIVLDQEKSKQSLGEIYEQEYLKQQQEEAEEKAEPDHEEIKKLMQSLFLKLDALSNFQYTPKLSMPEVKIVSNLPSIRMEEVAPVSVSDAKMLAPEEVQDKTKGELMAKTEKSVTDRKRERRRKKTEKKRKTTEREKRRAILEQAHPEIAQKNGKEKALKTLQKQSKSGGGVTVVKEDKKKKGVTLTSSKTFFTQLQEEVTTQIRNKDSQKRKRDKTDGKSIKKLKL